MGQKQLYRAMFKLSAQHGRIQHNTMRPCPKLGADQHPRSQLRARQRPSTWPQTFTNLYLCLAENVGLSGVGEQWENVV